VLTNGREVSLFFILKILADMVGLGMQAVISMTVHIGMVSVTFRSQWNENRRHRCERFCG
jgi:hypothetical protein